MNLIRVDELFDVKYGNGYALKDLVHGDVPFIARGSTKNGISGYVKHTDTPPFQRGSITVAVSGSVLESFYQNRPFYTAYHVLILTPKRSLSVLDLLFYCACLRKNKYRYSYGRQANKTLKAILLPHPDCLPEYLGKEIALKKPSAEPYTQDNKISLWGRKWKSFKYSDVFEIKKGFYNKKPDACTNGNIPLIGAAAKNNGVTSWYTEDQIRKTANKLYPAGAITVTNGASIGGAFYQSRMFTCAHHVNPLYLKGGQIAPYIAFFLISLLKMEGKKYTAFGREWRLDRMPNSIIELPVTDTGNPDWQFMEDYIKALPYSGNL